MSEQQEWSDEQDRPQTSEEFIRDRAGTIPEETVNWASDRSSLPDAPLAATEVEEQRDPTWAAIEDKAAELKPATAGSLRDRMRKRTAELEQRTSEIFPIPLYDQFVAVELKVIPWAKTEAFVTKNQRNPTNTMLYTAGDEIVAATISFHEIKEDDGGLEPIVDAHSWYEMATKIGGKKLTDGIPNAERVALIAMCDTQGVMALNAQYRQWLGGADTGLKAVQAEMKRDF